MRDIEKPSTLRHFPPFHENNEYEIYQSSVPSITTSCSLYHCSFVSPTIQVMRAVRPVTWP